VAPSAERKRAGFVISERQSDGIYGETFRAAGAGRRDLHALIVEPRIANEPGVASALLDLAVPQLRPVYHRAIVGTVAAVREGGDLVVVTEAVPESVSLHEVLAGCRVRGVKVPSEIVAAIGRAVIDATATAHAAGVIHGAIHPRSVLIDADGVVRLADFAIGRAVTTAVAGGASSDLLKGLSGYVAPELALGDEPDLPCDVFSIGALLFQMLSGELPPGSLHTTPAIERLVQRALDTELSRRFTSVVELQENFSEAIEDDRWQSAALPELARFVVKARSGDALDAATEDLLASLGSSGDAPTRNTIDLPGLGSEHSEVSVVSPRGRDSATRSSSDRVSGSLDSLIADLEDGDGDEALTEVDGAHNALRGKRETDPISEMLRIERARTGQPAIEEPPAPSGKKSGERARRVGETRRPGKITQEQQARAASEALASLDDDAAPEVAPAPAPAPKARPQPRAASLALPVEIEHEAIAPPSLTKPRKLTGLVWLVVLLAAGGALVWVILDLQKKNQAGEAADKRAQDDADKETEILEGMLDDPGTLHVTSERGAATWLRLGVTPVDSFKLPTGVLQEIRFELDGFVTADAQVLPEMWQGDGKTFEATVSRELVAGAPTTPSAIATATTAAEATAIEQRLPQGGQGVIHVKSTPEGADAWLYLGNGGEVMIRDVIAGRDYELRVLRKDCMPAKVTIKAEDWRNGGDPRLPLAAAPKHGMIEKTVTGCIAPPSPTGTGTGTGTGSGKKPK